MYIELAAPRFNRKACREPGIHAADDVVDMTVAQIGQRFCRNIASMAGLAIDNQMVLQLGPDVPMPSLNLREVDVQIGSGNESCRMFFRRSDIDQDETLLRHRGRLGQSGTQLLDREQVGVIGRHATDRDRRQRKQTDKADNNVRKVMAGLLTTNRAINRSTETTLTIMIGTV